MFRAFNKRLDAALSVLAMSSLLSPLVVASVTIAHH